MLAAVHDTVANFLFHFTASAVAFICCHYLVEFFEKRKAGKCE